MKLSFLQNFPIIKKSKIHKRFLKWNDFFRSFVDVKWLLQMRGFCIVVVLKGEGSVTNAAYLQKVPKILWMAFLWGKNHSPKKACYLKVQQKRVLIKFTTILKIGKLTQMKSFPIKENLGKKSNAQFPDNKTITNKREMKSFPKIKKSVIT